MLLLSIAFAHFKTHLPVRATIFAFLASIIFHSIIWQTFEDNSEITQPEVKPPLVIEVALASATSVSPAVIAPPLPAKAIVKSPNLPDITSKPVIKPPAKPKIAEPKKTKIDKAKLIFEEKTAIQVTDANKINFDPPPAFTPFPIKANPNTIKNASVAPPQSLTKATYSAPGLKNPPTRYPQIAQLRHWEGTVILEVRVLSNGSAGDVKIITSSGHEILDESAVEQVKSWHFIPAHQGEKSVEDSVRVPVSFKIKS